MNYITDGKAWTYSPYDTLSVAYYYLGDTENAIKSVDKAMSYNPCDNRITENSKIIHGAKK